MKRKHRKPHLKGIAAIRRDLGFSQSHLARLLQIPASTLAMVESGRRELSTAALIKLGEIELDRLAKQKAAEDMQQEAPVREL